MSRPMTLGEIHDELVLLRRARPDDTPAMRAGPAPYTRTYAEYAAENGGRGPITLEGRIAMEMAYKRENPHLFP